MYSPLTEIAPGNSAQLRQAWTYRYGGGTHEHGFLGGDYRLEVTPLVVGGIMYLSTPASELDKDTKSAVVALEPETGKVLWKYISDRRIHGRGIAYWPGDKSTGPRLFFGVGHRVHDGPRCQYRATGGRLRNEWPRRRVHRRGVGERSAHLALTLHDSQSAYDLSQFDHHWSATRRTGSSRTPRRYSRLGYRTGKLVWSIYTVPQPGEPNHETWPGESWKDRPGNNMWNVMTLDEAAESFSHRWDRFQLTIAAQIVPA